MALKKAYKRYTKLTKESFERFLINFSSVLFELLNRNLAFVNDLGLGEEFGEIVANDIDLGIPKMTIYNDFHKILIKENKND